MLQGQFVGRVFCEHGEPTAMSEAWRRYQKRR
jgi:hypothetical protein